MARKTTVETEIVETKTEVDVKSTFGEKLGYGLWTAAGLAFPPAFVGLGKHDEKVKNRKRLQKRKMELEAAKLEAEAAKATKTRKKKSTAKTTKAATTKSATAKKTTAKKSTKTTR